MTKKIQNPVRETNYWGKTKKKNPHSFKEEQVLPCWPDLWITRENRPSPTLIEQNKPNRKRKYAQQKPNSFFLPECSTRENENREDASLFLVTPMDSRILMEISSSLYTNTQCCYRLYNKLGPLDFSLEIPYNISYRVHCNG